MMLQTPPPFRYYYEELGSLVNNDFARCGSLTISIDQNHFYTKDGFHSHDYYELVYIRSGDGINIINGTSYPVTRGDIVLLRLSDFHAYHSFNNMEVVNCCIRPDLFEKLPIPEALLSTILRLSGEDLEEFETLLSLMYNECRQNRDQSEEAVRHYLSLIFLMMMRICRNSSTEEQRWNDLFTFLSQQYATVTLEAVARRMYLSKNYFCRVFRRKTGSTFLEYVNHLRISAAMEMLRISDSSVQEIWNVVGFHQAKQFYSLFRRETGLTPMQFRLRYGKKAEHKQP